jgi:hypothetical protein
MAIQVFRDAHFKGTNKTLETGKYPVIPIGIDRLSSVKVEPGTYAEFFITRGFRDGSFILFAGDYPDLGPVNDRVDAIKVFDHDADIFPAVEFFTHPGLKGIQQNLAGTGQITTFNEPFIKHDVMSSVVVPEGVILTIFEHQDLKGRSLTLHPGKYNLHVFGFDDKASSVQIVQNNLEVVKIEYTTLVAKDGEPILIESIAQNGSSLPQQANLTLERAYEESFTRSFENSTLFGLEISTTASVGVSAGPLSASVEQTLTTKFENTFTFGREETKTETITVAKQLNVTIPPETIAKAFMTLTPREATIEAVYTLRLKGTDRLTQQKVIIETKSASIGTVVIEKFTPIAEAVPA